MYSWSSTIKGYYLAGNPEGVSLSITDGSNNTITVTETNITEGSFAIDRMSSLGGGIPFGTVYSSQLNFSLIKTSALAAFDWQGAKIDVTLKVWNGSSWSTAGNGGRFYVRKRKIRASTIDIQAIGCMAKMDKISNKAGVAANNCKLSDIIGWVASDSGVTIQNPDFSTLANFGLGAFKFPTGSDMTDRSLLAWTAALLGCTVIETGNSDTVKLIRKSGSTQTLDSSNLFSVDNDEPVTMTGVDGYDSAGNKLSQGVDGYKMVIQGNAIYETATSVQSTLLSRLWTSLGGFTATPFSAECLSMPWVECADGIKYTDLDGNDHYSVVTHINYKLNGRTTIECGMAEEDDRNNALALAPFIERSSVSTGMLRTDAIKSTNYDYTSGNFSNSGTFLNLADGVFTSKNFAIDANGDAYIKGNVSASSGNIGALNITSHGLSFDDNTNGEITITDTDGLYIERGNSYIKLDKSYQSGVRMDVGDLSLGSMFKLNPYAHRVDITDYMGSIVLDGNGTTLAGDVFLDDNNSSQYGDLVNPLQDRLHTLETNRVSYTTTTPTADNNSGTLIIAILSSDPATHYNGYIYIITS